MFVEEHNGFGFQFRGYCRYCLAPLHETLFEDAAVFLALFYKLLIGERSSPWIAFKNTMGGLSQSLLKQ